LDLVDKTVRDYGYCVITASEGLKDQDGISLSAKEAEKDSFGHQQLGGIAPILANLIKKHLNLKYHWAVSDYLQRSARHIASRTVVEQAYFVGYAAVNLALEGHNEIMPYIKRVSQTPYLWEIDHAPLTEIANYEKFMPRDYIRDDGFHITQKCREYILPLISGEDFPPFKNGLPDYVRLQKHIVASKLEPFTY
jgi:6-phosphofructokinase